MKKILISKLKLIDGFTVEWWDGNEYILSKRNLLFKSKSLDDLSSFVYLSKFPCGFLNESLSRIRLFRRLLRSYFYNVLVLPYEKRIFATFKNSIGFFDFNGNFEPVKGLKRKTKVLRGSCAIDKEGGIYFGEYLLNPERSEVYIYYLPNMFYMETIIIIIN